MPEFRVQSVLRRGKQQVWEYCFRSHLTMLFPGYYLFLAVLTDEGSKSIGAMLRSYRPPPSRSYTLASSLSSGRVRRHLQTLPSPPRFVFSRPILFPPPATPPPAPFPCLLCLYKCDFWMDGWMLLIASQRHGVQIPHRTAHFSRHPQGVGVLQETSLRLGRVRAAQR